MHGHVCLCDRLTRRLPPHVGRGRGRGGGSCSGTGSRSGTGSGGWLGARQSQQCEDCKLKTFTKFPGTLRVVLLVAAPQKQTTFRNKTRVLDGQQLPLGVVLDDAKESWRTGLVCVNPKIAVRNAVLCAAQLVPDLDVFSIESQLCMYFFCRVKWLETIAGKLFLQ